MKKIIYALAAAMILFSGCKKENSDSRVKVILDTDMIEGFDDGVAMMMLLGSDNIDLLGVTTETGNVWATDATAYAVRQMEISGRKNIPIFQGSEIPLREGRYETMLEEIEKSTGKTPSWYGAKGLEKHPSWKDFYVSRYGQEPSLSPDDEDPVDFIINTIKENPGEITLIAIGPTTNVARALAKAPEIAALTKEIVYMGGAFYCEGNITRDSEVNVFYDPEAEKVCFNAAWPKQSIVSLDVCNTVRMDKNEYDTLLSMVSEDMRQILQKGWIYTLFQNDPDALAQIWDTISAALVIDPSILLESNTEFVDVNTDPSDLEYGKSLTTDERNSCRQAVIPLKIDKDKFWGIVNSALSKF